jgi:glycine hydroxymethyltransferase
MGMQYAEQIEIIAAELLKELFGCDYAEFRVGSGSLANLYAYMVCAKPGDTIMAFADSAAGLYGLRIHEVPYDAERMTIDIDGLRAAAERIAPKLILIAGSMCLFPLQIVD